MAKANGNDDPKHVAKANGNDDPKHVAKANGNDGPKHAVKANGNDDPKHVAKAIDPDGRMLDVVETAPAPDPAANEVNVGDPKETRDPVDVEPPIR